jgi:hypothetical protein
LRRVIRPHDANIIPSDEDRLPFRGQSPDSRFIDGDLIAKVADPIPAEGRKASGKQNQ